MRRLAVVLGGSAAVAWVASKYRNGEISYGRMRTEEWARQRMAHTPQISELVVSPKYAAEKPLSILSRDKGGVAQPQLFRSTENPFNTVSFAHCGPLTCGFPFLVHGGLLGTLVYNAVRQARQVDSNEALHGVVKISYRSPTFVNQILRIETSGDSDKLKTEIRTLQGKLLVDATYVEN